jgi:hypothetical protein
MLQDYCKQTSREIRKLGVAPKPARRFARVILFIQVSVCCLMGLSELPSPVEKRSITGSGKWLSGARAGKVSPDFSGLRQSPLFWV